MYTEIKYKDVCGKLTTPQSEQAVDLYCAEYYINGALKRVDTYNSNGTVCDGDYYLSEEESVEQVLSEFASIWECSCLYMNKQIIRNYVLMDSVYYVGMVKNSTGKVVFDNMGREIAMIEIDKNGLESSFSKTFHVPSEYIIDENPLVSRIGRHFYNSFDILEFGTFEFRYSDSKGNVEVLVNLPGFEDDIYYISKGDSIFDHWKLKPIFQWEEHPYYHSRAPFIPDTDIYNT